MSDAFADLWSSSAAIPPKTKPQTLASAPSSSIHGSTRGTSKPDAFSFLASSTQQSRYGSPNPTSGKRSTTSTPPVPPPSVPPSRGAASAGVDAFSDLFTLAGTSNGNVKSQTGMTLAERLALEAQTKHSGGVGEEYRLRTDVTSQDSAWLGLDSLARSGTTTPSDRSRLSGTRGGRELLDLDNDNDAADFNLGLAEQREGTAGNRDDDDILGMLSQPVEVVKAQSQPQKLSPSPIVSRQLSFDNLTPTKRRPKLQFASSSPPPHILGQIVEMGFSVEQARNALANTRDGRDVQAALETLLGSSGETESRLEDSFNKRGVEEAQELPSSRRGPPKGFRERERERMERMHREREREPTVSSGGSDVVSDMQEQADRLLLQASEIGLSVLNKASTFWKEKKEQVVKVYEERAATTVTGQKERADGEPKWMKVGGFKDDDDRDDHPKAKERQITRTTPEQRSQQQDKLTELKSEVDLFSTGPSKPSIQRSRRTPNHEIPTLSSQVAGTETPIPPYPSTTRDRPLPTASPSSLSTVDKHRTAGSSQFTLGQYASAIESYSAAINSLPPRHLLLLPLFNNRALARMRTGEYKAAADDAAQALGVVLVNDDSASGADEFDPNNAKETAMQVTISSWHPSVEPPFLLAAAHQKANNGGWTHPQGVGVDLKDGYVKALCRRAESSEGREHWSEALKYWELLTASDSAVIKEHLRRSAQSSAARCRRMIAGETLREGPELKSNPPVTKPRPTPVAPTAPSAALRSLQASNAQIEAEDNLRHQLKDSVDSKLAAWRTGKEMNIRALLASLDMVLWEELLRGIRVGGLHELVTPAQVKKGYMKVIARVHPDKLNAQNSTVEQRMLANAVFGTLSEGWTSFQSSNAV